ncbi:TonB-dependent receptor [Sphingobacterium sp. JB170]|uniref:TonB-dependent receptor n=1 Tax=Sphingobacterium sp. JB170 TaxID=1434842 RepID=UPI00097F5583|nr:TonB-dependent receptor [Sphingobacterium sp. JB170]SJN30128.1 TonB-dependent receptor [Sphingobacterium sp. JB170]
MNKQYSILLLIFVVAPMFLFAQNSRITGLIKDEGTNAPLAGVSIAVVGGSAATSSDFEGDYSLEVAPGSYTLLFSSVGYLAKQITDVKVESGKAVTVEVVLTPAADEIEEVVVSVSARKNTEQSILNMQKSSGVVMDGLSSQAIKRSGASTIASAVSVVPGVSVQEGKYLYVRGLGDRYTKSILNGVDIPGLDPDKNTVQMDIFPTGVLENIVVIKTASADLPADFTGGVVDIVTKDIPSQKQIGLSLSLGYNPDMHFKDNYVGYDGSGTDFLGFDNGNRKLPITSSYDIPTPTNSANRETLESITRSFNPLMGASRKSSLPDLSLGFDFSNQYNVWGNKLGVIGLVNYKKTTTFYEGYKNGIYQKPNQSDPSSELRPDRTSTGDLGIENVLLSGMLGLNYKTDRSKYTLNLLHIQNGESRAAIFDQTTVISNSNETYRHMMDYSQRSISNILLSGKHSNESADFITEWKISPSLARVRDKDVRQTTFLRDGSDNYVISTDAGLPMRIWRDLDEVNVVSKVDFTKKMQWFERDASFKFGGLYSYKQRDYAINNYTVNYRANDLSKPNGDPNAILNEENIYDAGSNSGFYMQGQFEAANTFDAAQHLGAAYASAEFKPFDNFRTVIGVRGEQYTSFFTGQNIDRLTYDNQKTINKFDLFPSLNLIYTPKENHNIRGSYSRTTARPSFKELSVVQIYDPLTDTRFLGNINLKPTYINNADLRYEIFAEQAQMIAVSGFYKNFQDPIELQAYSDEAPDNITPRNAPSANVYGLELEARKNFGFIAEGLRNLSLNANVTVVKSEIEMGENEYNSRLSFAREGEEVSRKRELQGQSPYLINAGFNYNNPENGLEAGAFYNVQGKTLEIIGFSKNSDVYAKPFNSLNLNLSKKIGANLRGGTISLKVDNLLDSKRLSVYEAFGAADQIYQQRNPRRTFSIGYSYNF